MTLTPEALRDAGMAQVENHTDPRLILTVDKVIADANARGEDWSANTIRAALPVVPPALIGARVKAASMRRPQEMTRVGWTYSDLPSTHKALIAVWRPAP